MCPIYVMKGKQNLTAAFLYNTRLPKYTIKILAAVLHDFLNIKHGWSANYVMGREGDLEVQG